MAQFDFSVSSLPPREHSPNLPFPLQPEEDERLSSTLSSSSFIHEPNYETIIADDEHTSSMRDGGMDVDFSDFDLPSEDEVPLATSFGSAANMQSALNKSTSRRRARSMFGMDAQGSVTDGGNRSWRGSNRVILPDDILAMESRGSHGESSPHLKTPPNTPVLGMVSGTPPKFSQSVLQLMQSDDSLGHH